MKKVFGAILSLVLLAGATVPALAQTPGSRYAQQRRYDNSRRIDYGRYDGRDYDRYGRRDRDRSVWEKSRDKITVAAGAGAGAVVGGAVGGKKGAIIGAILGAGSSALYTYGIRDRDNDRYERRR